jgi:hypothetical protein
MISNMPTGAGRLADAINAKADNNTWKIVYHEDHSITLYDHGVVNHFANRAAYDAFCEKNNE